MTDVAAGATWTCLAAPALAAHAGLTTRPRESRHYLRKTKHPRAPIMGDRPIRAAGS